MKKFIYKEDTGFEEDLQVSTLEEAIEEAKSMLRSGDWGDEGGKVEAVVIEGDGESVFDRHKVSVDIEPNHDALIRAAGGDPHCNHDWQPEPTGCKENPGVYGIGGAAVSISTYCSHCGVRRVEVVGDVNEYGNRNGTRYLEPEDEEE